MESTIVEDTPPPVVEAVDSAAVFRKIALRLIPVLFIAYTFTYLDRINVGYAKLQMQQQLGLSDAAYGLGAGIFFLGYVLFEVPSNLLLERWGARLTFLRILVLWGLVSAATMFVMTPTQFYIGRFALGVFEAGFFPGAILYLTYWFPEERRGTATSQFAFASPVAAAIAGPVSGTIMANMDGIAGWHGWQWMFLLEGLPTVLVGVICYLLLTDRPADAKWLSAHEKALVNAALGRSGEPVSHRGGAGTLWRLFTDVRTYIMVAIYFGMTCGLYMFGFWLPTMIQTLGITNISHIGWYSAIPFGAGAVGMLALSRSSDVRHERRWHIALSCLMAAGSLSATAFTTSFALSMLLFSVFSFFLMGALSMYWSTVPGFMRPGTATMGIAVVSSLGVLGGFFGPTVVGMAKTATGSMSSSLFLVSGLLVLSAVLMLTALPRPEMCPSGHR